MIRKHQTLYEFDFLRNHQKFSIKFFFIFEFDYVFVKKSSALSKSYFFNEIEKNY
jgi:hypothetical protein